MQHLISAKSATSIAPQVVFAMLAALICFISLPAQAQLYQQTTPTAFWGQEPLSASSTTVPTATGSTYGAIRMNGTTWNTIMANCDSSYTATPPTGPGDYNWSAIDAYHTTYSGKDLLYTWYRTPKCTQPNAPQGNTVAPNHLFSTGPCYYPLSGQAVDCYVTSFWNALMLHVCPSYNGTGPVSDCWVKNFELWNEFNSSNFWSQSSDNLAKMGTDAAAVIRQYCSNCMISAGSTTGGGAGYQTDPSFNDPNGTANHAYYDTALGDVLAKWYGDVGATKMPDFVSWHPYPTYLGYTNIHSTQVALDPAPFPETIYSGDGQGLDNNDGTGSDFHNGSAACPSSLTSEYSAVQCGDAVVMQISKIKTMAANNHMSGKPVWATEGGFGELYDIQGTTTGMSGLTADNFLRSNYIARWLILLKAGGAARAYAYSYNANDSNCFMPQYEPNFSPDCTGYGYSQILPANTQTPVGVAWFQVEQWLNGASTPSCTATTDHGFHIYACTVTRSNPAGYHATIYWVYDWAGNDSSFVPTPPSGQHFTQYQWLDSPNTYVSYTGGTVRSISGEPIMFEGIN